MDLLAAAHALDADEDELGEVLRVVGARLLALVESRALEVAAATLAEQQHRTDLILTIGVDEWDNGFFYGDIDLVRDGSGQIVVLPPHVLEAVNSALSEPLTELSYATGSVGRFACVTIDLATHSITY